VSVVANYFPFFKELILRSIYPFYPSSIRRITQQPVVLVVLGSSFKSFVNYIMFLRWSLLVSSWRSCVLVLKTSFQKFA